MVIPDVRLDSISQRCLWILALLLPPFQGEGWGGDGFKLGASQSKPIPNPAFPLKGKGLAVLFPHKLRQRLQNPCFLLHEITARFGEVGLPRRISLHGSAFLFSLGHVFVGPHVDDVIEGADFDDEIAERFAEVFRLHGVAIFFV